MRALVCVRVYVRKYFGLLLPLVNQAKSSIRISHYFSSVHIDIPNIRAYCISINRKETVPFNNFSQFIITIYECLV